MTDSSQEKESTTNMRFELNPQTMFSWTPKSLSPTGSQPSMLSESLIDDDDVELPVIESSLEDDPAAELDNKLDQLNILCRDETTEERHERLKNQEKWDRLVLFGYTCFVAASVLCNVFAMIVYNMGIIEIAFMIPLITGPVVIHQREGLIKCRKKREWIADLRNETKRIKQLNDQLELNIGALQKEVERLKVFEDKLKVIVEKQGQDVSVTRALVIENRKINETKKQLAEALAFENLLRSVLRTDTDGDHFIGDSELNLLAYRLEQIEGVPFTAQELCTRFNRWTTKNLRTLVDCVRTLYIEKRREQVLAKATKQTERSPRNLGAHLLWNDKLGYGVKV
ncbi:hypothetical protein HJC23_001390 [Cyclotella cryptica]|uniref:Transmembrane protein n=1 Tax=Cyclotella cryptica TaxID=29204 RepID=A0ABD3PA22_9STRA